jgi:hypothetical protein
MVPWQIKTKLPFAAALAVPGVAALATDLGQNLFRVASISASLAA